MNKFTVYLIISKRNSHYVTYAGYTKNLKKRLKLHNTSKGAKFTKGNIWHLIYKKVYTNKSKAMKEEYYLKKNYKKRNEIKIKFINKKIKFNIL